MNVISSNAALSGVVVNKVLRNTFTLLAMTLLFSAVTAGASMALNVPFMVSLGCSVAALGMLWFVIPRVANSSMGLVAVFATTGLLGFGLGPILNHYLALPNGSQLIMTAMGGTAVIFLGLAGYALTTRKNFRFMGAFLFVGILVAFLAGIGAMVFNMPGLSLAVSAMFVLLMSGLILYQMSEIIHGGETNYILATVTLYVAIYNMFTSLLHLLGAFGGRD
ncbi:MAG: Bax inhibitor-1/YccA family protein [Gammaproteobacteria bacterium]|nr:Bax inhibitor-1/YccA family protein [Gammaproteobacteria bacterium]